MFLHNSSQGGEVGMISDHQWCSVEWWSWWAGAGQVLSFCDVFP